MILVERKVLKEEKNYLNMVIQQKRNFKKWNFKRRFRKFRYKFRRSFYWRRRSRRFYKKKFRFPVSMLNRSRLVAKVFKLAYFKRYTFKYIKSRLDSIRLKGRLYRSSRYRKRKLWRSYFKKIYKAFYQKIVYKTKGLRVKDMRLLAKFYEKYGLYRILKTFVKYSRLRRILKRKRRVFRKKHKKLMRKISRSRHENLKVLSILFQSSIKRGMKKTSFRRFLSIMTLLKYKYKKDFILKYLHALERIRPLLNYKTMYISGKKYKIPVLMSVNRSYHVIVRWLFINSKESNDSILSFVTHINNSIKNEGIMIKHRREYHFQSFENKSYVRFLRFLKRGF